jgi:hypothetical protein
MMGAYIDPHVQRTSSGSVLYERERQAGGQLVAVRPFVFGGNTFSSPPSCQPPAWRTGARHVHTGISVRQREGLLRLHAGEDSGAGVPRRGAPASPLPRSSAGSRCSSRPEGGAPSRSRAGSQRGCRRCWRTGLSVLHVSCRLLPLAPWKTSRWNRTTVLSAPALPLLAGAASG